MNCKGRFDAQLAALKEDLSRLVEDIERHRAACAAVAERAERQASKVLSVRKKVHSAIRSLNELKEAETLRNQAVGLRRLSGSPDDIVCVEAGDIFSILNRSCAIAQNSIF
jgi:predicted transcriptional regulator